MVVRPGRGIYVAADAAPSENRTIAEACKRVPGGVDEAALERLGRREGDRVSEDVEPAQPLAELVERGLDTLVAGHVAGHHHVGADDLRQLAHRILQAVALVGERQPRSSAVQRLGDGPCDRALVGDAGDESQLAIEDAFGHGRPFAWFGNRADASTAVTSSAVR